MTKVKRVT